MGYILGKAEGKDKLWHGHVTAVTGYLFLNPHVFYFLFCTLVSPQYRRLGVAHTLMNYLEATTHLLYNGYFVDLFVRASNTLAISMYKSLGYIIYRQVLDYYSGEEDAYGE